MSDEYEYQYYDENGEPIETPALEEQSGYEEYPEDAVDDDSGEDDEWDSDDDYVPEERGSKYEALDEDEKWAAKEAKRADEQEHHMDCYSPKDLELECGTTVKVGTLPKETPKETLGADFKSYYQSKTPPAKLPPSVDLRPFCTEIEAQGSVSSCTANALAGCVEYLEKRSTGNTVDVSRLFIYYNERQQAGAVDQDKGALLSDGIKTLQQYGVCEEHLWPYVDDKTTVFAKPSNEAFQAAALHTIDEAHPLKIEAASFKGCLADGYPFVFGLNLWKSFQDAGKGGKTGLIPMPDTVNEVKLGGHAMCCVGYDDSMGCYIVRNSWGTRWGDKGYCYIPYAYFEDPKMIHCAWVPLRFNNLDFRVKTMNNPAKPNATVVAPPAKSPAAKPVGHPPKEAHVPSAATLHAKQQAKQTLVSGPKPAPPRPAARRPPAAQNDCGCTIM
eukprot:gnl/Hemi2/26661_TR8949_c0_g2_i1.p1 gnl/Hemi2/26661_TR8949_c0_g2~~gnl/Hemi2/26661_TR8949_c0_g2_i1.p1  ORF type:complete len:443 (-),score=165.37 gnl/Hemi2/26661_TR8949_c0_g2_i1:264-1592(-)